MRVTVADGQAVKHNGAHHGAGETLDVEERLAGKWLERQVVMPVSRVGARGSPKTSRGRRRRPFRGHLGDHLVECPDRHWRAPVAGRCRGPVAVRPWVAHRSPSDSQRDR